MAVSNQGPLNIMINSLTILSDIKKPEQFDWSNVRQTNLVGVPMIVSNIEGPITPTLRKAYASKRSTIFAIFAKYHV